MKDKLYTIKRKMTTHFSHGGYAAQQCWLYISPEQNDYAQSQSAFSLGKVSKVICNVT